MVAYPRDVLNQRATDLYVRFDRDGSGGISASEASLAARTLRRNHALRDMAADVFGLVPRSGAELLRFVESSPRQVAQSRIFGLTPTPLLQLSPVAGVRDIVLGRDKEGRQIAISPTGAITVDGVLPEGLPASARATDIAGELAAELLQKPLPKALQQQFCDHLFRALETGTTGAPSRDKDALFSGAMALLITLGRVCDGALKAAVIDRVLWGLSRQPHGAMREFYVGLAVDFFDAHFDPAQRFGCQELIEVTVRSRFPVDAWTENRTKPLRVREIANPEFWRRVCGYYRNRGFKLISKNAKDTRRVYERVIKDPSGSKAPLKVHVDLVQGEDNLYAKISDPKLHVLVYDGHWQLGGNGTQSVEASPKARGLTKLIVQDGCRTIQNYDEFIDRHREAMVIGSMLPILEDAKPILDVIFEGLARGETLGWVRKRISKAAYFSRNEFRKLRQRSDLDNDDRADAGAGGTDLHFDAYNRRSSSRFLKAIENANTSLYYHRDHEIDDGRRSYLGPGYADHVVPGGPISDPHPGEVVRLTAVKQDKDGKSETFFRVEYNPAYTHRVDEEYAAIVTAHVVMELIRYKFGEVSEFDRMRAIVMGATAIQYLGVVAKRGNGGMRGYLSHFGLPPIPPKKVIEFLDAKEAYGNDDQTRRFIALVDTWKAKTTA